MTQLKGDEVDAWWGSYSIKSTLPGLLAGLAASGLVVGTAWLFTSSRIAQLIVLGALGTCWLALLLLWIYQIFGINYRLTSSRLFVETGLHRRRIRTVFLATISRVVVQSTRVEKFLGVGRLFVEVQDSTIILAGVLEPELIAEKIRGLSAKAKDAGK